MEKGNSQVYTATTDQITNYLTNKNSFADNVNTSWNTVPDNEKGVVVKKYCIETPSFTFMAPPPVDCVKSAWTDWGECINGKHTRTATKLSPELNGGECKLIDTEDCSSGGGGLSGGAIAGIVIGVIVGVILIIYLIYSIYVRRLPQAKKEDDIINKIVKSIATSVLNFLRSKGVKKGEKTEEIEMLVLDTPVNNSVTENPPDAQMPPDDYEPESQQVHRVGPKNKHQRSQSISLNRTTKPTHKRTLTTTESSVRLPLNIDQKYDVPEELGSSEVPTQPSSSEVPTNPDELIHLNSDDSDNQKTNWLTYEEIDQGGAQHIQTLEAERLEAERLEAERRLVFERRREAERTQEAERRREAERLEAERRREAERLEAERLEAKKQRQEKAEKKRLQNDEQKQHIISLFNSTIATFTDILANSKKSDQKYKIYDEIDTQILQEVNGLINQLVPQKERLHTLNQAKETLERDLDQLQPILVEETLKKMRLLKNEISQKQQELTEYSDTNTAELKQLNKKIEQLKQTIKQPQINKKLLLKKLKQLKNLQYKQRLINIIQKSQDDHELNEEEKTLFENIIKKQKESKSYKDYITTYKDREKILEEISTILKDKDVYNKTTFEKLIKDKEKRIDLYNNEEFVGNVQELKRLEQAEKKAKGRTAIREIHTQLKKLILTSKEDLNNEEKITETQQQIHVIQEQITTKSKELEEGIRQFNVSNDQLRQNIEVLKRNKQQIEDDQKEINTTISTLRTNIQEYNRIYRSISEHIDKLTRDLQTFTENSDIKQVGLNLYIQEITGRTIEQLRTFMKDNSGNKGELDYLNQISESRKEMLKGITEILEKITTQNKIKPIEGITFGLKRRRRDISQILSDANSKVIPRKKSKSKASSKLHVKSKGSSNLYVKSKLR
jgi:hypothetical protein